MSDDRIRIDQIVTLNEDLFFQWLVAAAASAKVPEAATVFVHGYNTTFEQAVLRAAQIGFDIGLGQGIGLFSWPSAGKFLSYAADESSAEASKYALADFLEKMVDVSGTRGVNIIAHSMGCRCVLGAAEVLSSSRRRVLKRIKQIVLAAADVDSKIMPSLGLHVVNNAKKVTSYVSERDKALSVSGWLHSFPRVGITPPTFVLSGMDTIIVNNNDLGDFSHGYVGSSRVVLSDIFSLFKHNLDPHERHSIERVTDGDLSYWRLKS